ncbi:fatty acid desaturase family protein [Pelomonas sp. KK5]|uniref:fatty acid desaturase family protein n=1 Tax=Pelomonas sp. KK5 TaxID=1855730 RepID=UPI00097C208F|nr:fatty acid desaturase family protein [Pelomonas sp. KK5]
MEDTRIEPIPREALQQFLRKSDAIAWRMLAFNWALIIGAFALVMVWPGWLSGAVALVVLGGRQLGLGILTHECAHRSFFSSRSQGECVGQWLCGAPVFVDLAIYRGYHMTHHVKTGTAEDPDLSNYAGYPVARASLLRKLGRDLAGRSGLRAMLSLAMLYGSRGVQGYSYQAGGVPPRRLSPRALLWNLRRIALVNALMLAACWAAGHPLAYLLWPLAWLTSYMAFSRIRNAAEHGALPGTRSTDIWTNTRTVEARWWERLTVAPNYVNFHFEHHLVPTVPSYRLPELHAWLKERGLLAGAQVERGYGQVLRRLVGA